MSKLCAHCRSTKHWGWECDEDLSLGAEVLFGESEKIGGTA